MRSCNIELSATQDRLWGLIAEGLTNAEIEPILGLKKGGLNYQITILYAKLNVRKRMEAVRAWEAKERL